MRTITKLWTAGLFFLSLELTICLGTGSAKMVSTYLFQPFSVFSLDILIISAVPMIESIFSQIFDADNSASISDRYLSVALLCLTFSSLYDYKQFDYFYLLGIVACREKSKIF